MQHKTCIFANGNESDVAGYKQHLTDYNFSSINNSVCAVVHAATVACTNTTLRMMLKLEIHKVFLASNVGGNVTVIYSDPKFQEDSPSL